MSSSQQILVDTATLLNARFDRFDYDSADSGSSAAIHAILFYDKIFLDGSSVDRNRGDLMWLWDVDGSVDMVATERTSVASLYERGAGLVRELAVGGATPSFLDSLYDSRTSVREIVGRDVSFPVRAILNGRGGPEVEPILGIVERTTGGKASDADPRLIRAATSLSRLFYYTALQEQLGCTLLLDRGKSYLAPTVSSPRGVSETICQVFDETVAASFRERRDRWLGPSATKELSLPLLSRYVASEADARGWSIGRMLVWLRDTREVERFRSGLNELQRMVEVSDNSGVDTVLADLEDAAQRWSSRIGAHGKVAKLKVTVPLQFAEPQLEIPVGALRRRSTADKMLVFIDRTLSYAPL